jgi:pimeloyl-ACP methyl ester carboxylesterase
VKDSGIWGAEPVRLATSDGIVLSARYYVAPIGPVGGPAYLIGHGFTGSSSQVRVDEIAATLCGLGAPVLSLDFRGHGGSGGLSSVGVTETADVAAGVAWLRARCRQNTIVTIGFSMGSSIVVRHAGLGGDCDGVVSVSGPGRWFERATWPMKRVNFALETRTGLHILRRFFRTRLDSGWELLPAAPVELAGRIRVPFLVVHGDEDSYFGLEHPRMLAAVAPDSELWIERGMGHAENATSPQLLERIDRWARLRTAASATMQP